MNKIFFIISLLFISLPTLCITPVTPVKSGLISAKKNELFFGFETVTKENASKWQRYIETQKDSLELLKKESSKFYPLKKEPELKDPLNPISIGYDANDLFKNRRNFSGMADALSEMKKLVDLKAHGKEFDLFIAYIKTSEVTDDFDLKDIAKVEMSMAVATNNDVPFQMHMGITRAPVHFNNVLLKKDGFVLHQKTSLELHAFAVAAIQAIYGDAKSFMINQPLRVMKDIIVQALKATPDSYQFQSDGLISQNGKRDDDDFSFVVRNWHQEVIFEADKKKANDQLFWFLFTGDHKASPYLLIDNQKLRALF